MEWFMSIFSGIGTKIMGALFGKKPDHNLSNTNNNTISITVNELAATNNIKKDSDNKTLEYGMVNIKVKGNRDNCENGTATVIYLGSLLVDSPSKSIYQDFVEVAPESKIDSIKFTPEATPVDEDQIKRNPCILKYGLNVPDNGFISGEAIVKQALRKKAGGIGFHTPPYYTKDLVFNIDFSETPFICGYGGKAKLKTIDKETRIVKEIKTHFYENSSTYIFRLKDVPAGSNIAFEWENDEVQ